MRILIFSLLIFLLAIGCTSKKIRSEVNQELAVAPVVKSDSELYSVENKILMDNQNLSQEQRSKLSSLIQKTRSQNVAIDSEIMKTKAVLFETLINEKNSKAKLNILEKQILKLNRKKVRSSLSAYREAKNIVGKSDIPLEQTLRMIDTRPVHEF